MEERSAKIYKFNEFKLDEKGHQLWQGQNPVKLTPKAFETLLVLIRRNGEMVSKEEMLEEIWKDTFVEEGSLTRNISVLRKIFSPKKYIKTIPRLGYRFVAEVQEINSINEKKEKAPKTKSTLAVLPFKYLSNQIDESFFGLGLTDALITRLCNLEQIEVRPTSAVLCFSETNEDFHKIGKKLNAELLLDGTIQQIEDNLRVTVQLIQVKNEKTIWSDKVDATFTDVFSLQDSISKEVVNALTLKLNAKEKKRFGKHFTKDSSAYKNYLRGRYFWNKRNNESFFKAIEYFKLATDADPLFALAYTGLADCYNMLNSYGVRRSHDVFPKAKAAAEKALEIDPELAEAHASLGYVLRNYDWDFAEAEKEFNLAIKLNPNYSTVHQWYAFLLVALERFDEAIRELEIAQNLDPLSLPINASFGLASFFARDFDNAISENLKLLEMEKDFMPSRYNLGLAYIEKEMYEEAILQMEKVFEIQNENHKWLAHLGSTYAVSGKKKKAKKILDKLLKQNQAEFVSPLDIAMIYARLGEKDNAFKWLNKSVEEREANLIYLRVDPEFDVLRSDARFLILLEKVGLPI